jgi:hypothetical protein
VDIATATPAEIDTEIDRLDREQVNLARQIEALRAKMDANARAAAPLHAEYARRPWTRIYRVDNSNGHVHTTTACSTTYATTDFQWFPELSGKGATEIVELAGEYTCLVCFGQVRPEILEARKGRPCRIETDGQRKTREEREAADAARQAKAAAKNAKALVRPVGISDASVTVTTKADAWGKLTDALIDIQDWSDGGFYAAMPAEHRERNLKGFRRDVEILRAALVESLPELTAEQFEAELAKKLKAKKTRHNGELRAAGLPARY